MPDIQILFAEFDVAEHARINAALAPPPLTHFRMPALWAGYVGFVLGCLFTAAMAFLWGLIL